MRRFDGRLGTAITHVAIFILAFPCGLATPACLAEDRFFSDPGGAALTAAPDANQRGAGNQPNNQPRLREGTMIPLTVGRIVLRGRRWEFVSGSVEPDTEDVVAAPDPRNSWLISFKPQSLDVRRRAKPETNPATTNTVDPAQQSLIRSAVDKDKERRLLLPPNIVLSENLMLQRIAAAIRANPSDNRWEVSGEITEFFDENRLIIRTAQRANSK